MMMDTTRYPVGIQTFKTLRNERCVYADKTGYIYQLVSEACHTYFLSRPRRFGKSLLISTLEAYFQGRKELFEGLQIYDLEKEWKSYPVLHFDFSRATVTTPNGFSNYLDNRLTEYEKEYGITDLAHIDSVGLRFGFLIERIHKVTGKHVVILIDEYDKPLNEVLDNPEMLKANQDQLMHFLIQIKAQGAFLRFCLITGVKHLHSNTIFSGFNNANDISRDYEYANICGITKDELRSIFSDGINSLAETLGESLDRTLALIYQKYDGYRFTDSEELVFNPFSILNCLDQKKMANYWIKSGTPKVFVDFLSKSQFSILELEDLWVSQESMEGTYSEEDPIPLLFQTGYLTIKDQDDGYYRLGIPNGEVRKALVEDLIPKYMGTRREELSSLVFTIRRKLNSGDVDGMMRILQSLVAAIPYQEMDIKNVERTYHLVIYELFLILGVDARCEVSMSGGRIDMVVKTFDYIYVIEFKLGGTVDEALSQIDDRGYALPWSADGRQVFKVGVVFSPDTRTISDWRVTMCE